MLSYDDVVLITVLVAGIVSFFVAIFLIFILNRRLDKMLAYHSDIAQSLVRLECNLHLAIDRQAKLAVILRTIIVEGRERDRMSGTMSDFLTKHDKKVDHLLETLGETVNDGDQNTRT